MQGLPHAPCRLQREAAVRGMRNPIFASTRSVQIATQWLCKRRQYADALPPHAPCRLQLTLCNLRPRRHLLCLHTLRADCNKYTLCEAMHVHLLCLHTPRADCNVNSAERCVWLELCLHTLRADCNVLVRVVGKALALCLHTLRADCNLIQHPERRPQSFASTRSVQIATFSPEDTALRYSALPPHAPCRLQRA